MAAPAAPGALDLLHIPAVSGSVGVSRIRCLPAQALGTLRRTVRARHRPRGTSGRCGTAAFTRAVVGRGVIRRSSTSWSSRVEAPVVPVPVPPSHCSGGPASPGSSDADSRRSPVIHRRLVAARGDLRRRWHLLAVAWGGPSGTSRIPTTFYILSDAFAGLRVRPNPGEAWCFGSLGPRAGDRSFCL